MSILTTKIIPRRSFPTYQLHSYIKSKTETAENAYKICILETFKWLRARFSNFNETIEELIVPEPEEYNSFSLSSLHSFSINKGFNIDVVYIESKGIWAFCLTEPDMGANTGRADERKAVNGRTFSTNISYRLYADKIEFGLQTLCSQPCDVTEVCEVYRPALIRMLVENPNITIYDHFHINGKPIEINTSGDSDKLIETMQDKKCSVPVILVAEAPFKKEEKKESENAKIEAAAFPTTNPFLFSSLSSSPTMGAAPLDLSGLDMGKKPKMAVRYEKVKKDKPKMQVSATAPKAAKEKLPEIDYTRLARKAVGFAFICHISENCFKTIENKTGIKLSRGDIVITENQKAFMRLSYTDYGKKIDTAVDMLMSDIYELPLRKDIPFGNIRFVTDARLLDLEERKHESLSAEEKADILIRENAELKGKINSLQQVNADASLNTENYRLLIKENKRLEDQNAQFQREAEESKAELEKLSDAYKKSAYLINFYRNRAIEAAYYPTSIDDICDWIKDKYSETVCVSPKAEKGLRKYKGSLDIIILCGGIAFLNAYALYRKNLITKNEYELIQSIDGWEIESCGKSSLNMHPEDYSFTYEDKKCVMDLHIKHGNKSQQLIRVYFCWDEIKERVIIGYLPDHLPTASQGT